MKFPTGAYIEDDSFVLPPELAKHLTHDSNTVQDIVDALLESESIEQKLVKAAKGIKHCGDYGTLYYNPDKREVHWTMADSDGQPDFTGSDEIEKILSLPGVTHVELGDEWSPDEDEGWKNLI
jgi:hypothetical protein